MFKQVACVITTIIMIIQREFKENCANVVVDYDVHDLDNFNCNLPIRIHNKGGNFEINAMNRTRMYLLSINFALTKIASVAVFN